MSFGRKLFNFLISLAIIAFSPIYSHAQSTVTVTGHTTQVFGTPLPGGGANGYRVCFRLVTASSQPMTNARIVGTGGTIPTASGVGNCISPDSSGFFSTNLVANDQVESLGAVGGSQWQVSFMHGGSFLTGSSYYFKLVDGVENLDTKLTNTIVPVVPAPTGDTTYIRADGLNAPVTGAISWTALQTFVAGLISGGSINAGSNPISGGAISGTSIAVTGTVTGANIPASIPGAGACTNQFVRTLNAVSAPTCNTVGSSDLASSLALVTPNIGAATGTSLSLAGTGVGQGGVNVAVQISGNSASTGGMQVFGGQLGVNASEIYRLDPSTGNSFVRNLHVQGISAGLFSGTDVALINATGQVLSNGSQSAPAHSYLSETGSGWFWQQAGIQGLARTGNYILQVGSSQFAFANGYSLSFSSGAPNSVSSDVGISRCGVGILCVGNAAAGDTTGSLRAARIGAVRFASNFAGADCGAKINAASSDLAGPGEIWVDQICGTTGWTAVSTTAGQVIKIIQGGTYLHNGITLGQTGGIAGPGCGGNLCAVILQSANSSNLAASITPGNQSFIFGVELDGNKANNPTGGVGVSLSQKQHVRITNALIQNFKAHGIDVRSSLSGDESTVPVVENTLILFNDGNGLNCVNTTDGFMGRAQFEQNGLGAQGTIATVVNVSGTGVTWVSGPKWSTDSSLVGNYVKFTTGAPLSNFIVSAIGSTTSMTLTASAGTLTGTTLLWGHGVEAQDCPGWRYEHSDFGGNGNDGLILHGTSTGRGSGQNMIVGNEWGSNHANDLELVGFNGAYTAINQTISGNMFLGSGISPANVFSDIAIVDGSNDSITGNVFRPANRAFGVSFGESAAGRTQNESLVGNTFVPTFGTGAFATNTTNNGQNLKIYANAEGTTGPSTFGSGAGSIKFQGGIANNGTGLMHVRQAAGCSTAAAVNARCTATVTLPGTMNDTSYTITGCSLTGVTNPLFVAWMGSKTTTSFQVIIGNTADSAAIATGTLECGVIHD